MKKRYCCVPSMILETSSDKKIAMKILSSIYDKRYRKRKKAQK